MSARIILVCVLAAACGTHPDGTHSHGAPDDSPAANAPASRLDVPPAVRENLGITFVTAALRPIGNARQLPGRFHIAPTARWAHHTPRPGTVSYRVRPQQRVEKGQVLAVVRSPALCELQHGLHRAVHAEQKARQASRVARAELEAAKKDLGTWRRRLRALGAAKVRRADLEAERDRLKHRIPVLEAQVAAARADISRERHHYDTQLTALASLLERPREELVSGPPDADAHEEDEIPSSPEAVLDQGREPGVLQVEVVVNLNLAVSLRAVS